MVTVSLLSVFESISVLYIYSFILFFRFYIEEIPYSICLHLTFFTKNNIPLLFIAVGFVNITFYCYFFFFFFSFLIEGQLL